LTDDFGDLNVPFRLVLVAGPSVVHPRATAPRKPVLRRRAERGE